MTRPALGKCTSLRADIRRVADIADAAGKRLLAREIFPLLTWRTTLENFHVTLNQMCEAEQINKRRVRHKGTGVRFSYAPGPAPVDAREYRVDRAPKIQGFMAAKREREAKARGRAR